MARIFNADIYTGRYNSEKTFPDFKKMNIKVLLKNKYPHKVGSFFAKIKFQSLTLPKYDLYILCGGDALSLAKKHHPNMWWSIAPRIWLYDLFEEELKKHNFILRPLFQIYAYFIKKEDQNNVQHVDEIIAISKNVKKRIKKIYNRDSTLIYPGFKIRNLKYKKTGDFYLSTARLTPDKRVDVIVKAFTNMPDKKLIVIGSGTDFKKISRTAANHKNIKILGRVDDSTLANLYGNCIATVFASLHEDFGLVAVESMAAGKPVIASGDMGFAETVIDKKTGYLITPTEENIINAVKKLTPKKAANMRKACQNRAILFSEDKFISELKIKAQELVRKT
jgi:glycosyltransferase involved in cell wall biosynthesis